MTYSKICSKWKLAQSLIWNKNIISKKFCIILRHAKVAIGRYCIIFYLWGFFFKWDFEQVFILSKCLNTLGFLTEELLSYKTYFVKSKFYNRLLLLFWLFKNHKTWRQVKKVKSKTWINQKDLKLSYSWQSKIQYKFLVHNTFRNLKFK